MLIHTVSALAAAGKTYQCIRYCAGQAKVGERFIFTVPSTALADQVGNDFRARGVPIKVFHSADGSGESVSARLTNHFQRTERDGRGEVVIMTFAAFQELSYIEGRRNWTLIIDEIPSPVFHARFSLHENRDIMLRLIHAQPWNAAYSLLSPSEVDTGCVRDASRNRHKDEATGLVASFAGHLISPHWQMFAENGQLATFRDPAPDRENAIDLFGLLNPSLVSGFRSATIMGACFEDSLLYRYWQDPAFDIAFQPHPAIKPRFTRYPNADLVTIQYAIERPWSGRLRDMEVNGRRVLDIIIERCVKALDGAPYARLLNKLDAEMELSDGSMVLPHSSHGLNSFQHLHNAMILPALNPPPAFFKFCNDMAHLSSDEVATAIHRQGCYQPALRTSIRNLDDTNAKCIQVADRPTAEWLAALIGTPRVERLPGDDIVPPDRRRVSAPKSNAEMIARHRATKKAELIAELDGLNGPRKDILKAKGYPFSEMHVGSIFTDKMAQYPITGTRGDTVEDLLRFMREAHAETLGAKHENYLISPCAFDPDKVPDTWRGKANVVSISGIWLDNDGGDLTPDEFAKMFRVPMVIYNTHSSTPEAPRWRVWIPTSHLTSVAVHDHIHAQLRKMLLDRGYYGKRYIAKHPDRQVKAHGFEEEKMVAGVLFYLPGQAAAGQKASFFNGHHWDAPTLNPYEWVDRSIVDHRPPTIPRSPQPPSEAPQTPRENTIAEAEAEWQGHAKGTGNHAFFRLAAAYHRAGLDWFTAEQKLREQAIYAHGKQSRRERLADMKNYRRKLWR